jgi:twinkle protein
MGISDKISSLRDMVSDVRSYIRPDPERLKAYQSNLLANEEALSYLKIDRGLAQDTIDYFGLGYDIERNAIVIPVFKNNELVNMRYRMISPAEKQPKYTQEKDCEVWLFNEKALDVGLKKGAVLVVEGEFDCMATWQSGIKNVVSPASGKDSYGIWLELLDPIPEVYIAYDNDKAGKDASYKFAERIGIERCKEVSYPEDVKDANEFFKKYKKEDFRTILSEARPFYTRKYNDLIDVINLLREDHEEKLQLDILPDVKLTPDHLVSIAGSTNAGKTMYALNIAKRLAEKDIPTLVLPFERGIQVVGSRFLSVLLDKTDEEMRTSTSEEWAKTIKKIASLPLYFSIPKRDETIEVLTKAKRILGIKAVIVDHLDYMIRGAAGTEEANIRSSLHELKEFAIANQIMMFVVTHTRRVHQAGGEQNKKPTMHDIRGSTAVEQDSETVIILHKYSDAEMEVDIQKNKGKMTTRLYNADYSTGVIGKAVDRAMTIDDI